MGELAYVNGRFCELAEAVVSIEDRGFQFADGVYEVAVALGGRVFRLGEHLERLRRSMASISLEADWAELGLERAIDEGLRRSGFDQSLIYVQITRGVQPRSHVIAKGLKPTVVMTFKRRAPLDPGQRERGLHVVTVDDFRWMRCDIKAIALLPNVMAKNKAIGDGYDDALFVGPDGEVREGTSANVFAIRGGRLVTPSVDEPILHGITRRYVLECAQRADVPNEQRRLSVDDLASADEAFISSTSVDILSVTRLNGRLIGTGRPGPVTQRLYRTFMDGLPRG
ncbi:MAG: D-amino acid aminotransferase [Phycisphaerales bacterium]|nr:D-amino acid aminotransferase [Phycisphaerales bacterium]